MQDYFFVYLFLIFIYYVWIYTPSNEHFQAFPLSKINSKTSTCFNFKANLNIIAFMPYKVIYLSIFYNYFIYLYLFICLFMHLYTFKSTFESFPGVSNQFRDNFSVSFFQEGFKFHSLKPSFLVSQINSNKKFWQ